tara:strand:+ start:2527 stop:3213 length:687 start_codon:yes stop_codon:yes gene_type:complete
MEQVNVHYIDEPFRIEDMPLGNNVYVVDNYLEEAIFKKIDHELTHCAWQKTNQVQGNKKGRGGLPQHSLWGACFFNGHDMKDGHLSGENGYRNYLFRYLDRKLRTDFGFDWVRFQYAGANSQTMGQHGTCHSDCHEDDEWNLSFLFYTNQFWNPNWGGKLRFYDETIQGGIKDLMDEHEIGHVDFKPNRLLMFDGRIPHGAEAPTEKARYIDRKSIVIRGDEIQLCQQ